MSYTGINLQYTSLPTLIIERKKLYHNYPQIGFGAEGSIFKFNDALALKLFSFFPYRYKLQRKFEKIELLGRCTDANACFPMGIVGDEEKAKEGYYYNLVTPHPKYPDFDRLRFLKDMRLLLKYIIEADKAMQRFHKMGLTLGDIHGDNIMIDESNHVKFIDTDNWQYMGYDFDLIPGQTAFLSSMYQKPFSRIDNDRFLFAMMVLQYFIEGDIIRFHHQDIYFKKLISLLDVSGEVKDGLRQIFSDADDKPSIGPILKKVNVDYPLISQDNIHKVNTIF